MGSMTAMSAIAAPRPGKDDISLAAWSLNQSFFVGHRWTNLDLARIVREQFNLSAIELVNQFFENPRLGYLKQLKKNADSHGVRYVLIMIDGEGDMSALSKPERMEAAIAHRKWIDIAHYLGCHAIRCNMGGPKADWQKDSDLTSRAAESFHDLLGYAKGSNLNLVIENHGGASSDPAVVEKLMKAVDNPNFGTLPDFGNINEGDNHAEVIRRLVPWAKGISVKSGWAADGSHPRFKIEEMLQICKDSGFHGFWGIESSFGRFNRSGERLSAAQLGNPTPDEIWQNEVKGVELTKAVIERVVLHRS